MVQQKSSSYAIIQRSCSLLIYGADKANYEASCQIDFRGRSARIHTLNGRDFYKHLAAMDWAPFRELGISCVVCEVRASHARLLRASLRGIAEVVVVGSFSLPHGISLSEVEIRLLPKSS